MTLRKIVSKAVAGTTGAYVGQRGEIFYNSDHGALSISDGVTVGGNPIHIHAESVIYDHNIIPSEDNTFTIGSPEYRWQSIHIGPGTIFVTDQTLGTDAGLTVDNGVLQINGANQLQVGQLKFVDNTIESTTPDIDIEIGLTSSSGDLLINRNVVLADTKTLTYQHAVGYQDGNQNPIEVLDQTKQVHTFADGTWKLNDGVDGKVLYLVMLSGGSAEDIYIRVSHLRKIVGGQDVTVSNVLFRPFPYGGGTTFNTVTTMVFANGAWHPSQGATTTG